MQKQYWKGLETRLSKMFSVQVLCMIYVWSRNPKQKKAPIYNDIQNYVMIFCLNTDRQWKLENQNIWHSFQFMNCYRNDIERKGCCLTARSELLQ